MEVWAARPLDFFIVREWRGPGWLEIRSRLDQLPRQAQLADSGLTATGGTGATRSTGQLGPGLFPLAHGASHRVLKLRGYGDAIVPQVAAEFIAANLDIYV